MKKTIKKIKKISRYIFRSAITGKFVSEKYARKYPKKTVREVFKVSVLSVLFILLMLPIYSNAQNPAWARDHKFGLAVDQTITSDTLEVIVFEGRNGIWSLEWTWDTNGDTLKVIPLSSIFGSIYTLYPGLDTLTYLSASSTGSFEDVIGMAKDYYKFLFISTGTVTGLDVNWGFKYETK